MQVRDLIELLKTFDPYDHVKIEIQIKPHYSDTTRKGEPEAVTRRNEGPTYVVIKCRE